jgi:alkyl sulfatase BDS1-like metallo-beta-lactamase superfamily hydrolase
VPANRQPAPTANPSLWRQAQLCRQQGLFQVTDGIYQIRGFDLSNMTVIEGDRGIIIVDPLISVECAAAALKLYRDNRGDRPVTGLLYTHPHSDHFGGSRGVLPDADIKVPVIAPKGFMEHAVGENIFAGTAMARRAVYMYGGGLKRGPEGQISTGLGSTISTGTTTLIPPTLDVTKTGQEEVVDGVRLIFQMTPGTEAPCEVNFYIPDRRALCMAENATHNLHNILTLRGALVRDAQAWASYLDETIVLFAQGADVSFASHHWPTWGREAIIRYLSEQRDLYAYLHDQTVRMMNQGLTGIEIAESLVLPRALQTAWHAQGYYGSVSHNVKAIYQRYMGWYDGNPAHLWEHPPTEAGQRYVACMGGVEAVVRTAQTYVEKGDLRFAATLLGHAVFADPKHADAKEALASVFETLGYGAENGPWRNCYLTGAAELRGEMYPVTFDASNEGMMGALSVDQLLVSLAIRIDGPRARGESFVIDLHLTDQGERRRLIMSNGVLIRRSGSEGDTGAGLTCKMTKQHLLSILANKSVPEGSGLECVGNEALLARLVSLITDPDPRFRIVTP